MLNQVVLVGRMTSDPSLKEIEDGSKYSNITLAIPRSYKNSEGVYETDFVDVTLWNVVAENTAEYCRKGDLVGVKGRLESYTYDKDGEKKYQRMVIAEKVTFLSTKSKDEVEHDER